MLARGIRCGRLCSLAQLGVNAMTLCDLAQPLISCAQKRRRTEKNRGDQMRVNQPDPAAVQTASFNSVPHFAELSDSHLWQKVQKRQSFAAFHERTKSQLSNDQRMDHNLTLA